MIRRFTRSLFLLTLTGLCISSPGLSQGSGNTTIGGFVDVYYAHSLAGNSLRSRTYTTQPLRANEFTLNLGFVEVKHQADNVRGRFALQTGTYVESNLAAEPELLKHVLEASAGTRISRTVWVDFGILPSHIGFEGIVSKDNWTYSRSILADYSPYYESGVCVTATLSDEVTARGFIINGWQNIQETNDDKAVGTQIQYRPTDRVLVNWSSFLGNEQPDSLASRLRIFNDLYGVFHLSERWSIAVVFDIGTQKIQAGEGYDSWHAGCVMVRRILNDQWSVAARLEYYSDENGVIIPTGTPGNFSTIGGSVNMDFAPAPNVLWRMEVRTLHAKEPVYPTRAGHQTTDGFVVLSAAMSF